MSYTILEAKEHPLGRWFWQVFSRRSIQMRFQDLIIQDETQLDPDRSILLLSNHVSWWDGFWAYEVCRRLWGKSYHVMMLEEQLQQRHLLRYAGAYSVKLGHRSVIQSLNYSAQLMENPKNLVQIFPQGKIHSLYQSLSDTDFSGGAERILQKVQAPVQLIFAVAMVDYFSHSKPTLYYYLENGPEGKPYHLKEAYLDFYERCRLQQVMLS